MTKNFWVWILTDAGFLTNRICQLAQQFSMNHFYQHSKTGHKAHKAHWRHFHTKGHGIWSELLEIFTFLKLLLLLVCLVFVPFLSSSISPYISLVTEKVEGRRRERKKMIKQKNKWKVHLISEHWTKNWNNSLKSCFVRFLFFKSLWTWGLFFWSQYFGIWVSCLRMHSFSFSFTLHMYPLYTCRKLSCLLWNHWPCQTPSLLSHHSKTFSFQIYQISNYLWKRLLSKALLRNPVNKNLSMILICVLGSHLT